MLNRAGVSLPNLLADRAAYRQRLQMILPQHITGTTDTANDIAAAVAFACMYVGAIGGVNPVRPSTVVWMSDAATRHRAYDERRSWYAGAMRRRANVASLLEAWGEPFEPWYADNTREPIRDQTFRAWVANGAMQLDESAVTNASLPRYTLAPAFAELLSPELDGDVLVAEIAAWQQAHLSVTARLRSTIVRQRSKDARGISVALPGGGTRMLHPGVASEILKGVIEEFAKSLTEPHVVFLSQPGEPVNVVDEHVLARLGISVDHRHLLPDCLIANLDPAREEFWLVEIVATDGPVTEERKLDFVRWATANGLRSQSLCFLTAFASRTAGPAKRLLPVLARGSYAWYLDEPDAVLSWADINQDPGAGDPSGPAPRSGAAFRER